MVVDEIKDMYRQGEHHIRLVMKVLSTTKNMKKKIHLQGQLDLNRSAKMKSFRSSRHDPHPHHHHGQGGHHHHHHGQGGHPHHHHGQGGQPEQSNQQCGRLQRLLTPLGCHNP